MHSVRQMGLAVAATVTLERLAGTADRPSKHRAGNSPE